MMFKQIDARELVHGDTVYVGATGRIKGEVLISVIEDNRALITFYGAGTTKYVENEIVTVEMTKSDIDEWN